MTTWVELEVIHGSGEDDFGDVTVRNGLTLPRGGDVYALTANLAWAFNPRLLIRPELKYDVYDGGGHLFAVGTNGLARKDAQLLGVLNLEFRF